MASTINIWLVL